MEVRLDKNTIRVEHSIAKRSDKSAFVQQRTDVAKYCSTVRAHYVTPLGTNWWS
jgi:hypothetical protein